MKIKHKIRFAQPDIDADDVAAVQKSLQSDQMTNAGQVRKFETKFQEFTGGGMAVATTSCMGALHLAALCTIKPGDDVIVPALTHPATALAVSLVGANPVFVDVDRKTGNMNPVAVQGALTPETTAIMVLHYLGVPADVPDIMARCPGVTVIEDCALGLGTFLNGTHVGLLGHIGCFSFYPAKHITTGEGGMLLTKYPTAATHAIERRHFGQRHERGLGLLEAVPDWVCLGLNYRMTEMQGALGASQMRKLRHYLDIRYRNRRLLWERLDGFEKMHCGSYALSVFVGPERNRIAKELKIRGIETSVYYKVPVPYTSFYEDDGEYPVAAAVSNETICFPIGPHITEDMIDYMAETLREVA